MGVKYGRLPGKTGVLTGMLPGHKETGGELPSTEGTDEDSAV